MIKLSKNKKIILMFAVIAAASALFLFWHPQVYAAQTPGIGYVPPGGTPLPTTPATPGASPAAAAGSAAGQAAFWAAVIFFILQLIFEVFTWIYGMAGVILNQGFYFATQSGWFNNDAVLKGWSLFRDLSNIWIILSLLLIAIATILRLESMSAKRTLSKLIIAALLINFSLPLAKVVIDFGNIITFQFVKNIGAQQDSRYYLYNVSQSIENGWDVTHATLPSSGSSALSTLGTGASAAVSTGVAVGLGAGGYVGGAAACTATGIGVSVAWLCGALASAALTAAGTWLTQAVTGTSLIFGAIRPYVDLIITDLLLLFAIYVMCALAFFLLTRTVALILLLVLSPAAFALSFFPQTVHLSKEWWSKFINQVLFAPAVAMMLWVATTLMQQTRAAMNFDPNASLLDVQNGRLVFFFLWGFMLYGCLLIAKRMGAYGAETAMGWFTRTKNALLGFAGDAALRRTIAPIGQGLAAAGLPEAVGRVSPTLGFYANRGVGWLKTRGKAVEMAEEMANLGMKLPASERATYFRRLNSVGKEAMLKKMNDSDRAEFLERLTPEQRQIAENIMRSPLFAPKAQVSSELASFKRLSAPEQRAQFEGLSREAQNAFLHDLNAQEQAEFVENLGKNAQDSANAILRSPSFSAAEYQNFRMASFLRKSEDDQHRIFATEFNNSDRETLLKKMSDDQKAKFIAGLSKTPKTFTLTQDESDRWKNARLAAENILTTHLSAPELKSYQEAEARQFIKDSGQNLATDIMAENEDKQKRIFKAATDYQKASLSYELRQHAAGKTLDEKLVKELSPEEMDKFRKTYANFVGQKTTDEIKIVVETMQPEEIDYLVQLGDRDKIASLMNTSNADIVKTIGERIHKQGTEQKYLPLINPDAYDTYITNVLNTARKDAAGQITKAYEDAFTKYISAMDIKAFKKVVTPEIIKQPKFMDNMLSIGTLKNFADIASDPVRAEALVESMKSVDQKFKEALEYRLKPASEAFLELIELKGNNKLAQDVRDTLAAGSTGKRLIERLLSGKGPQPKIK